VINRRSRVGIARFPVGSHRLGSKADVDIDPILGYSQNSCCYLYILAFAVRLIDPNKIADHRYKILMQRQDIKNALFVNRSKCFSYSLKKDSILVFNHNLYGSFSRIRHHIIS